MKLSSVAVQLYTLRDHCKTPVAIAETLRKVAAIGYQAVQASGLGPIEESELVRLCKENKLTLCATHESGPLILAEPAKVVERLKKLGCKHTAYPYPAGIDFGSEASVAELISKLDAAGKVFAEAGLTLSYHNHNHEFRKLNGRVILERIYAETNPRYLQGEIDTYWVQYGGGNPAAWCRSLKNRLPLLHMKDYRTNNNAAPEYAEIGQGTLDWKEIISAAEASGCEWFIVEQDTTPGDPFDSLKMSFDYIRDHLVN
ncbi:MAG: sugar phosphate isomerase/epimerase [Verrucomicrobiota bacterium]|nr:sugar phosphate isomerase/epimerase [Verrucomicrobiota bacterium]